MLTASLITNFSFFWQGEVLVFELRASHLWGRLSTAWATSLVPLLLVILVVYHLFFIIYSGRCPGKQYSLNFLFFMLLAIVTIIFGSHLLSWVFKMLLHFLLVKVTNVEGLVISWFNFHWSFFSWMSQKFFFSSSSFIEIQLFC
jgi:hypothetical protein